MRRATVTVKAAALKQEILAEAKVVRLPMGTAEVVAEKVAEQVAKWAGRRSAVTQADLNRQIAKEMLKYSRDLAYVFQNRDKII